MTAENALLLCNRSFDEKGHTEPWRNEVARDLNRLLGRVAYTIETSGDETPDIDLEFADSALALVDRVATFEEIHEA